MRARACVKRSVSPQLRLILVPFGKSTDGDGWSVWPLPAKGPDSVTIPAPTELTAPG